MLSPITALTSFSALSALAVISALTARTLMFCPCCGALSPGPFSRAAARGRGGI
jgi:hypothetical protein